MSDGSDPLSTATRSAKRNLLAATLVTIIFKAFDIAVDKIPLAGLQITFMPGMLQFLLWVVLVYFLAQFSLYYYADINNIKPQSHQVKIEDWRQDRLKRTIDAFIRRHRAWLIKNAEPKLLQIQPTQKLPEYLATLTQNFPSTIRVFHNLWRDPHGLIGLTWQLYGTNSDFEPMKVDPDKLKEAERKIRLQAKSHLYRFPIYYALGNVVTAPRLLTVRALYFVRIYGLDGFVPGLAALLALGALSNVIDLHWIASMVSGTGEQHQSPNVLPGYSSNRFVTAIASQA